MPAGTTLRNVRVADELWDAARAVADEQEETVSEVIRAALTEYVAAHS